MIERLASVLASSSRIMFFTGAGISTGSGIPDYRGPRGIWRTRRPVYFDEFMSDHGARVRYWQEKLDDREAWGAARPNAAHAAIADLEATGRVTAVVTQNVDGLHAAAGTADDLLVELHGTVRRIECMTCHDSSDPAPHFAAFAESGEPPRCVCGGHLKPATISFGQALRSEDMRRAQEAAQRCDLVVALGSTLSVTPAADVPLIAAHRGVPYVIVNQGPTEHDSLADLRIDGDVADVLPPAVGQVVAGGGPTNVDRR